MNVFTTDHSDGFAAVAARTRKGPGSAIAAAFSLTIAFILCPLFRAITLTAVSLSAFGSESAELASWVLRRRLAYWTLKKLAGVETKFVLKTIRLALAGYVLTVCQTGPAQIGGHLHLSATEDKSADEELHLIARARKTIHYR